MSNNTVNLHLLHAIRESAVWAKDSKVQLYKLYSIKEFPDASAVARGKLVNLDGGIHNAAPKINVQALIEGIGLIGQT